MGGKHTACNPSFAAALPRTLLWKPSASPQGSSSTSVISWRISVSCMVSPAALAGGVNASMCVLCRGAAPHTCACRLTTPSRSPATGRRTWASSGMTPGSQSPLAQRTTPSRSVTMHLQPSRPLPRVTSPRMWRVFEAQGGLQHTQSSGSWPIVGLVIGLRGL